MKKRIIATLLILALIFSLSACGKKAPEQDVTPETEGEEEVELEETIVTRMWDEVAALDTACAETDNPEFTAFVKDLVMEAISSSYLNLHVYYLDPAAAGYNMDEVEIGFGLAPNDESYSEDRSYYQSLLTAFNGFDRAKLSKNQQDEYDAIKWDLEQSIALTDEKFDYYEQLFAPPNSLDQEITSWLATWELRRPDDLPNMVKLLNSVSPYVDSCIEYAKKQQEKELFMTDFDVVIASCNDIIDLGTSSFTLRHLLEQVDLCEGVNDEDKAKYKEEIEAAYEESYIPAITKIRDAMEEMKGGYNNTEGFSVFPNGKEYVEAQLNLELGVSGITTEGFTEYIEQSKAGYMNELFVLNTIDSDAINDFYNNDITTGYTDANEILDDIKEKMLVDHPEVKNLEYNIEHADKEEKLEEKNVAAYFLIPPIDGDLKQQMRVNPENEDFDSLQSYTTVCHEGFPGHMYQYAYTYDNIDSDYLKIVSVSGTVEGYAVYSQYGALDYLTDIGKGLAEVQRLDDKLGYMEYANMDIEINCNNMSLADTLAYLKEQGYGVDEESAKEIYDYLRANPASYEPYAIGYEFIAELRRIAVAKLEDKFDAKEFNKAILDAGTAPLVILTKHVYDYVNSAA